MVSTRQYSSIRRQIVARLQRNIEHNHTPIAQAIRLATSLRDDSTRQWWSARVRRVGAVDIRLHDVQRQHQYVDNISVVAGDDWRMRYDHNTWPSVCIRWIIQRNKCIGYGLFVRGDYVDSAHTDAASIMGTTGNRVRQQHGYDMWWIDDSYVPVGTVTMLYLHGWIWGIKRWAITQIYATWQCFDAMINFI